MGWSIGYDSNWNRDIGYGVPAVCDHPDCNERIDRGLSYVCSGEPYGGNDGCGLYFCGKHRSSNNEDFLRAQNPDIGEGDDVDDACYELCERCAEGLSPFQSKPDVREWIEHKLTDPSWQEWRIANKEEVERMRIALTDGEKT